MKCNHEEFRTDLSNETAIATCQEELPCPYHTSQTVNLTEALDNAASTKAELDAILNPDQEPVDEVTYQKTRQANMLAAVKAYAKAHYNQGGWDLIVECYSDAELLTLMGKAKTERGAIWAVAHNSSIHIKNDARKDVEAEVELEPVDPDTQN